MTIQSYLNGHSAGQTVAALQTLNRQLSTFENAEVKIEIRTEEFRLDVEYQLYGDAEHPCISKVDYEVYPS